MATPALDPLKNPGGSDATEIQPPMPYPAYYNFVGAGERLGLISGFTPPNPGGPAPGFLGGQRLNPRVGAARPNPTPVPARQQALAGWADPTKDAESDLNPFIQGGGDTTAAYPATGNSEYGLLFQTNGEPLPLYPAPRPSEILPTRLIFPGVLNPPQTRLQPVPGNPVISAANQAWYDSLGIPANGPAVSGAGGPAAALSIASVPSAFNEYAPLYQPFLQWHIQSVMWLGVWVNLSAYFEKAAAVQLFGSIDLGTNDGLPFAAIPGNRAILDKEDNSPFPTQVEGAGFFGWMGCCRACWPCSQQCWWLGLLCGLEKYGVAIVAVVFLLFQLALMEGVLVSDFIAVVPKTATWGEFLAADAPAAPRVAIGFVYLIFWLFLLGYCFNRLQPSAYFRQLCGGRILLRSLAANYEARSYSYCNMVFWTILFEFDTVIIPAYFPFVLALLVTETYGGSIQEAAVLVNITWLVYTLHRSAAYTVQLVGCFGASFIDPAREGATAGGPGANDYVRGSKVDEEITRLSYIYLWTTGLGFIIMLVLIKIQMTLLYLWAVPVVILIYMTAWQALPYNTHGWPVCPAHTGPCLAMTAIATSLLYICLFCFYHGCFLFPCLCAPEVPGYLFFPPNGNLESPLAGVFDLNFPLILARFAPNAPLVWDCVWEPPAESVAAVEAEFEADAFSWKAAEGSFLAGVEAFPATR